MEFKINSAEDMASIIREYRKQQKITQEKLAGFSRLSRQGILKLEKKENDIKLSTLLKVLSLLGFELVVRRRKNT
ncbi:MAG: helix-turn-helix domain-containing protein [Oligoflexia bacterium]|nr:helix-turn-helix domain-containing protein [Oligoflexia bacterium]